MTVQAAGDKPHRAGWMLYRPAMSLMSRTLLSTAAILSILFSTVGLVGCGDTKAKPDASASAKPSSTGTSTAGATTGATTSAAPKTEPAPTKKDDSGW